MRPTLSTLSLVIVLATPPLAAQPGAHAAPLSGSEPSRLRLVPSSDWRNDPSIQRSLTAAGEQLREIARSVGVAVNPSRGSGHGLERLRDALHALESTLTARTIAARRKRQEAALPPRELRLTIHQARVLVDDASRPDAEAADVSRALRNVVELLSEPPLASARSAKGRTTLAGSGAAPAGAVRGTVTEEASGDAIAGAQVHLFDFEGALVAIATTASDGSYEIAGLTSGDYFARSDAASFADELFDDIPCPQRFTCTVTAGVPIAVSEGSTTPNVDFALLRAGVITGTVTDETTGEPIADEFVDVRRSSGGIVASAITNADGVYEVGDLGIATHYVQTDTRYYLDEIYDDVACGGPCGSPTAGDPIEITPGATFSAIDFALQPGGTIAGTILHELSGEPIPHASVRVTRTDSTAGVGFGATAPDGTYEIGGIPTGNYSVRTVTSSFIDELYDDRPCPGFCDPLEGDPVAVTEGETTSGIDFVLAAGGRILGTVTEEVSGEPVGARVVATVPPGIATNFADTAPDGTYEITGLTAGDYLVQTWSSSYMSEIYDDIVSCDPAEADPITVAEGGTVSGIDFALRVGGGVQGSVRDEETGDPIEIGQVTIFQTEGSCNGGVGVRADGSFLVPTVLPPGIYLARTEFTPGYVDELYADVPCPNVFGPCDLASGTPLSVTAGETLSGVEFLLAPAGSLAGTVVDATSGAPLRSVLRIFDASGSFVGLGHSLGDGKYDVPGLPAGSYLVDAFETGFATERFDDLPCPLGCEPRLGDEIAVAAKAETSGIDIALQPLGACGVAADEVALSGHSLSIAATFEACSSIAAGSGFTVAPGGALTLRAGEGAVLGDGFSVASGASLTVEIDPSLAPD